MKGIEYYYARFQVMLDTIGGTISEEFRAFAATHTPRDVFLWLEERRKRGELPKEIEPTLTDFYWEIF